MSARHIQLFDSAQRQTGAAVPGAAIPIPTLTMGQMYVDVTAVSGTTPQMALWLQTAPEEAGPWTDMPYDLQMTTATAATDIDANETRRNVTGTAVITATGKHLAIFKHMAGLFIRPVYDISGTFSAGQGFTFSAGLVGK